MADDFRNDPDYQQIRDETRAARDKSRQLNTISLMSGLAGTAAIALGIATAFTLFGPAVGFAIGVPLMAVSLFTGYKGAQAKKDAEIAKETATARLTGHYVSQALEKQKAAAVDMTPDLTETKMQDMLAARRAREQQAKAQGHA